MTNNLDKIKTIFKTLQTKTGNILDKVEEAEKLAGTDNEDEAENRRDYLVQAMGDAHDIENSIRALTAVLDEMYGEAGV